MGRKQITDWAGTESGGGDAPVRVDVAVEREDGGGRLRLRPGGDGAGRPAPRRLVPARRRRRQQRQDQREQSHEHEARGRWCHVGAWLAETLQGAEGRRQTRMGFSPCLLLPSLPFPLSLNLFFLVVWAYGWGGGFYIVGGSRGEKMGPTASSVDVLFVLLEGKTKKKGSLFLVSVAAARNKKRCNASASARKCYPLFRELSDAMRCGLLHLRSIS